MELEKPQRTIVSRREFLTAGSTGALILTVLPLTAEATPENARMAIEKIIGSKPQKEGPVKIILAEIAENGGTVPLKVSVDSPMTPEDHVQAVHAFTDGNPLPEVASYFFGPHNGKAYLSIRLRLLKTQNVIAVAELSNGEAFVARKNIKVTIGGCGG
jgi:sulfur-oxidizing protein SoxY